MSAVEKFVLINMGITVALALVSYIQGEINGFRNGRDYEIRKNNKQSD